MSEHEQGPLMLAATDVMRPPPLRIAKLFNAALPRSVQVRVLVAGGIGAVLGLLAGIPLMGVLGLRGFIFSGVVGSALAVIAIQWKPQPGENMFQILWVMIRKSARQRKLTVDGQSVALYIGVARLDRAAQGATELRSGAVPVRPGSVDERGAIRSVKNRNLLPEAMPGYPAPAAGAGRLAIPDDTTSGTSATPRLPQQVGHEAVAVSARTGSRLALPDQPPPDPAPGDVGVHHRVEAPRAGGRLHLPDEVPPTPPSAGAPQRPGMPDAPPPASPQSPTGSRLHLPDEFSGTSPHPHGPAAPPTTPSGGWPPVPDELLAPPASPPESQQPARRSRLNLPD